MPAAKRSARKLTAHERRLRAMYPDISIIETLKALGVGPDKDDDVAPVAAKKANRRSGERRR